MLIAEDILDRFEAIAEELRESENVLTVPMNRLKELYGGHRLKKFIRRGIEDHLHFKRIGFIGRELPQSQSASVRLYLRNTPVARFIEAVECDGPEGDEKLRELARGATEAVTKDIIQELTSIAQRVSVIICDLELGSKKPTSI